MMSKLKMVTKKQFTLVKEATVRLERLVFNSRTGSYTLPSSPTKSSSRLIGQTLQYPYQTPKRKRYWKKKKSNKLNKTDKKSKAVKRGYRVRRSRRKRADKKLRMKATAELTPVDEIIFRVHPNHLNGYSGTFIYSKSLKIWTEIEPKCEDEVEYDPHAMLKEKRELLVQLLDFKNNGGAKKQHNFCFYIGDESDSEDEKSVSESVDEISTLKTLDEKSTSKNDDEKFVSQSLDLCDIMSATTSGDSVDSGFSEPLIRAKKVGEQRLTRKKSRYPRRMIRHRNLDWNSFEACSTFETYGCDDKSSEHSHFTHVIDRPFVYKCGDLNYAMLSLPKILRIGPSGLGEGDLGVFTKSFVSAGTVFGPFIGEKSTLLYKKSSDYCWSICDRYCDRCVIDGSNTRKSNWLRYVNCARNNEEENLTGVVNDKYLYYMAFKDIKPNTQLMVYYGSFFAKQLKIDVDQFKRIKLKVLCKGFSFCDNIVSVYINGDQKGKIHLRSELNSSKLVGVKRRVLSKYLRNKHLRFQENGEISLTEDVTQLTENPIKEISSATDFSVAAEDVPMFGNPLTAVTDASPNDSLDMLDCVDEERGINMDATSDIDSTDLSVPLANEPYMDVKNSVCVQDSLNLQTPLNF